jgi:hypothetical protein
MPSSCPTWSAARSSGSTDPNPPHCSRVLCVLQIEIHNFRKAMISIGLQLPEEVEVCLFAKFDVDNNGTLDYIEFCKYFLEEEYQQLAFSNLKGKAGREASLSNSQQLKVDEIHKALKDRFRQLTGPRASAQIKDVFRTIDIVSAT